MSVAERVFLGPFIDLKRFLVGLVQPPPVTRRLDVADLAAAQEVLIAAGCDLSNCTGQNLHTRTTGLSREQAYDFFADWRTWPISSFFAVQGEDRSGIPTLSYRFYGLIPVVSMKLKCAVRGQYIIYDLVWGIGAGGYHSFLFDGGGTAEDPTRVSIFTIFPPTLFLTGLHDEAVLDIYDTLDVLAQAAGAGYRR